MHKYELQIIDFMKRISAAPLEMEESLLKPASRDVEHYIRKLYEEDPNRPFTIRMSNIGKPICQLMMDKNKAARVNNEWNFPLRMMYGGVIEGLAINIMRRSGIVIQEEQTPVKLRVVYGELGKEEGIDISGTLDVVIDGKVWDIKSASPIAFKDKFENYETLREHDDFGYLCQLYGYSAARGLPPGGWIVIDKSSGDLKVVEVGNNWKDDYTAALNKIESNVAALMDVNAAFIRQYSDKIETFKKKETGNRVLNMQCSYCPFKYSCWPNLKHKPSAASTAYDKPYKYYTVYNENKQLQSKGQETTAEGSSSDTGSIS